MRDDNDPLQEAEYTQIRNNSDFYNKVFNSKKKFNLEYVPKNDEILQTIQGDFTKWKNDIGQRMNSIMSITSRK
jgi:hypothetical protein